MKPKNPSPEASSQPSHRLLNGSAAHESASSRQHGNSGERAFRQRHITCFQTKAHREAPRLARRYQGRPLKIWPARTQPGRHCCVGHLEIAGRPATRGEVHQEQPLSLPSSRFHTLDRYTDIGQVEHSDDDVLEHAILSITLRQGSESVKRLLEFFPAFDPHASQEASEIHLIARGVTTNVEALIAAAALMRRAMGDECKFSYLPPPSTATKIRAVTSVKAKPWPKPTLCRTSKHPSKPSSKRPLAPPSGRRRPPS